MIQKLRLPFPLLSDARGELAKRHGLWNAEEGVAVPSIVVVDRSGEIRYLYAGTDFADRPGDEEILAALDELDRRGEYEEPGPEVSLSGEQARDSVRPDRRPMALQQLIPYYRGAFFTTVALKKRFGESGSGDAAEEVERYQQRLKAYNAAIQETAKMGSG
jgi:hypothetical protein